MDDTASTAKRIPTAMPNYLARKAPKNIHSELHQFVDETRKMWSDKASFGTWLGVCEGLSVDLLRRIRDGLRDSKPRNIGALFFHKVREERKKLKTKQ